MFDLTVIPFEFAFRVLLTVVLLVQLFRATRMRLASWQWQRTVAHSNGLRLLVTEDRLARIAIKWLMSCCLILLIGGRLFLDEVQRIPMGDGLISVITCALVILLWVDDFYANKMIDYEAARKQHAAETSAAAERGTGD